MTNYIIATAILLSTAIPAVAAPLDQLTVLQLSASDRRAVIATPDGTKTVIGPGDIVGEHYKVVEFSEDQITLDNTQPDKRETVVITLHDKRQSIKRLTKVLDEKKTPKYSSAQTNTKAASMTRQAE